MLGVQVAGRSLSGPQTDSNTSVQVADPLRLAKLRAANEIVRASWQYKVCSGTLQRSYSATVKPAFGRRQHATLQLPAEHIA
jgi:hypothetical protein